MERLSEKEDSELGMADRVTAEVVRGGKPLGIDSKTDDSDKPKGAKNG